MKRWNAISKIRKAMLVSVSTGLASLGLSFGLASVLPPLPASAADPCGTTGVMSVSGSIVSCTYSTVGSDTFTVPTGDGITSIRVAVAGGGGGGGTVLSEPANGGDGALA